VDSVESTEIEVSLGTYTEAFKNADPFAVSGDEVKTLSVASLSAKRRISRGIEKAYTGTGGAKSKYLESWQYTGYDAFQVVQPPYNLDYLAQIYDISSPNRSAINAKTSNIVGLGWELIESPRMKERLEAVEDSGKREKMGKKITRERNRLKEFLDTLNDEDTLVEVLSKAWIDYEATGNGYIEIGRTKGGQIGYIGHAPSTTIRVRVNRDGFVQVVGNKTVFFRNFGDRKTSDPLNGDGSPNELIHIKKYSPTNTYYGVPDVMAAKSAVAGDEFAQRFNLDYFEHKAVPKYMIVSKGISMGSKAEKSMHEFFLSTLKGKNHRSIYIPLPADTPEAKVSLEIKPIESGSQDSSFNQYRKSNRDEVLMSHRVPLTKVGIMDGVGLAAARDSDKNFKEQVTRPEQARLEKRLNRIIAEFTDIFVVKLNELTLTDEDTQSKIDERGIRNQWLTPNEIRARQGLAPLKGGDKVVDLKPQQAAEARAQQGQTRTRDQERTNNQTDSAGEGRNTQGSGRTTA